MSVATLILSVILFSILRKTRSYGFDFLSLSKLVLLVLIIISGLSAVWEFTLLITGIH